MAQFGKVFRERCDDTMKHYLPFTDTPTNGKTRSILNISDWTRNFACIADIDEQESVSRFIQL
jgi:hypothetical protein